MPDCLKGKRILMFSPHSVTQHYCDTIVNELRRRGAEVIDYDERPSQSTFGKILLRYFNRYIPQYFIRYISKIVKKNKDINFDYVFVIRAEGFTPRIVNILRKSYPNAQFILYLWDLLKVRNINDIIPLFDRVLTFDLNDSQISDKFIFRPTFCAEIYEEITDSFKQEDIDVMFVGTLHTNRYKVLEQIKRKLEIEGISSCFKYYVPALIVYLKHKLTNRYYASIKEVKFTPYNAHETIALLKNCKSILDLRYNDNENLSMRAFEALVTKRKYITNNPAIKRYNFYNPNNILVISENNPIIPKEFFQTPFKEVPTEIVDKYRVREWINDVFFNNQQNFLK